MDTEYILTVCPSCTAAIVEGVPFTRGDPAVIDYHLWLLHEGERLAYHQPTIDPAYPCAICEEPSFGEAHLFICG